MKAALSIRSLASMAALAAVLGIPAARAGDSCLDEAKQGYKECKDGCTEDFRAAKDACLDRDHVCVEACRAGRDDCRTATGVDAAIASCNDTLTAAKQRCRDAHPAGSRPANNGLGSASQQELKSRSPSRTGSGTQGTPERRL